MQRPITVPVLTHATQVLMAAHRPRPEVLVARLDLPVEEWPYLDEGTLLRTRSSRVCMTCNGFRHHAGVHCIPLLT